MMRMRVVLGVCLLFNAVLGFLPTKLDFNDPDLSAIFCDASGETSYHKAITRESIRREVRELFIEEPPVGSSGFTIPEDATLSEMFHLYYGEDSSATRFYKAVNTIAWADADVDSMESTKYDARLHFDGEMLTAGQDSLSDRHNAIVSSLINDQSYDYSRQQIGYSLHTIQDFYSHTNWIELGNEEILANLGIPGFTIPNIADVNEAVCGECVSADGSCAGNVLMTDKITSGFYEYDVSDASSFIVQKPTNSGKCSHGGSIDSSRSTSATGGINKATTSTCFSPHSYLHDTAIELATMASQNYLNIIRSTIGNDKFRLLFDLYQGSALVIVIDTTGSMSSEIDAVKRQVAIIVATAPAELYILVPYNDPEYGPLTKTTNSLEFLSAVNALEAGGGGGIKEEMVWSGLNLALVNTPDYSNLYLFTDAGGFDYLLMNGDFALAQDKNVICTTIYSYANDDFAGPPYTDDTDYQRLALVTGGDFIVIDEFTIDDIIVILGDSINSSVVTIALRKNETGTVSFDALVDDTVSVLGISISGQVDTATITNPDGVVVDLMDQSMLENTPSVTVNAYSNTLMDISFDSPVIGAWTIDTDSSSVYSVTADGLSTLDYLVEFTELDIRPPRPNYKLITGQPIEGMVYYVEITLVGWIDSEVTDVFAMEFLDGHGTILSHVDNTVAVDDEFYIQSEPLPNQPFFVAVHGNLISGNPFTRLYETLITPSQISIRVDTSESVLSAPPDTSEIAVFYVTNYGDSSTYDFYATDDKNFIMSFSPNSSFIVGGEEAQITVNLYVPVDAIPWTASTIVVTASSRVNSAIVNSAITYFVVLPEERDITAPICVPIATTDCSGFNSATNCDGQTWIATATISDTESGLSTIYSQPSNNDTQLDTIGFTVGTTDAIDTTLTASCCIREAQIIAVDKQGNMGVCNYDLGVLDGVLTFTAIDEGQTWIYLMWNVTEVPSDLFKYTLQTDYVFNYDIVCFDIVCYFNSTNLSPCSLHHFELTPFYDPNQDFNLVAGTVAITEESTLDKTPGTPTNGQTDVGTDSSTMDLTWDAPQDPSCISFYEVCYIMADNPGANATCLTTTNTSAVLTGLEGCYLYNIQVVAVTAGGLKSNPLIINANSADSNPGEPTNLVVYNTTLNSASLSWDQPIENPQCVYRYLLTWSETEDDLSNTHQGQVVISGDFDREEPTGEFSAVISPLDSCTNYTFMVIARSDNGLNGAPATAYGETEETLPSEPIDFELEATSTTSISASWSTAGEICLGNYLLCYDDPETFDQICQEVVGTEANITGLISCTLYAFSLTSVTPSGTEGGVVFGAESTFDEIPGAPENLTVTNVTSSTVTVGFDPPTENVQCADGYSISYIDMYYSSSETTVIKVNDISEKSTSFLQLTGIDSCTDVWISVTSVSPEGFESASANTTATTLEAQPSQPENLVADDSNSTAIEISWFVPSDNERCIVNYRVIYFGSDGTSDSHFVPFDANTIKYQYTLVDLSPSTSYTIVVNGVTALGMDGLSSTVIEVTPAS